MVKRINLLVALVAATLAAPGRAERESHGGDAYVWEFISTGDEISNWIGRNPGALSFTIDAVAFRGALTPAVVLSTDDELIVDGIARDAMVRGVDHKILINRARWRVLPSTRARRALVAHEVLQWAGLPDADYYRTNELIDAAWPESVPEFDPRDARFTLEAVDPLDDRHYQAVDRIDAFRVYRHYSAMTQQIETSIALPSFMDCDPADQIGKDTMELLYPHYQDRIAQSSDTRKDNGIARLQQWQIGQDTVLPASYFGLTGEKFQLVLRNTATGADLPASTLTLPQAQIDALTAEIAAALRRQGKDDAQPLVLAWKRLSAAESAAAPTVLRFFNNGNGGYAAWKLSRGDCEVLPRRIESPTNADGWSVDTASPLANDRLYSLYDRELGGWEDHLALAGAQGQELLPLAIDSVLTGAYFPGTDVDASYQLRVVDGGEFVNWAATESTLLPFIVNRDTHQGRMQTADGSWDTFDNYVTSYERAREATANAGSSGSIGSIGSSGHSGRYDGVTCPSAWGNKTPVLVCLRKVPVGQMCFYRCPTS